MGRRYATELLELDTTYKWAIRTSVEELAESIACSAHHPLIAVGSGGSLTSAHFAELLHALFTGQQARTLTPYELVTTPQNLTDSVILLCSAGGSNPDAIIAAQQILKRAPFQLLAITTKLGSQLQVQLEDAAWPRFHAFNIPAKKDGFLATNSLLASIVLLTRAYEKWSGLPSSLPDSLEQLVHPGLTRREFFDQCSQNLGPLIKQDHLVLLYGVGTKPAAMDLESRFTEAALAAVLPSDFRNFAHGRHHWLSKHADTTGVLAFCIAGDDTARRTLELLPESIPHSMISVEPGIRGAIAAVCQSLLFAQIAGNVRGIDPGRPNVPIFGRKLYHLKAMPPLYPNANEAQERMNLAIERKSGYPISSLEIRGQVNNWIDHYKNFIERLAKARIRCVVIDYDGTLCAQGRRLIGPTDSIANQLNRLLAAGLTIAIATGRGKSVREALIKIITEEYQSRLLIGYHNGAEIAPLDDLSVPAVGQPLVDDLAQVAKALISNKIILKNTTLVAKGKQISLTLLPAANSEAVIHEASRILRSCRPCGAELVTSSHSVDIIAPTVHKTNVIDYIVRRLGLSDSGSDSILCIGDRGQPPGNDAELLAHPLSLSVDEVNEDPLTCWGIARPGLRFDQACHEYLVRLRPARMGMRFDVSGVKL